MWAWLIGGYTVVLALLAGFAGLVATWVDDKDKRADAFKVLKVTLVAVTGAGGLLTAAMTLHQAGLL